MLNWIPYRFRSRWDQLRVRRALRGLEDTAPLAAARGGEADAEVHVLVCRRDAWLTVLALKSLLRFPAARLAVSLTDDGSLRPDQRERIERHIPGCRWLPRYCSEESLAEALRTRPHLDSLYGSEFHMIAKLLHPVLLSRCPRVIQLDADTAFFREPLQLLSWARGEESAAYYLHDVPEKEATVPPEVRSAWGELAAAMPAGSGGWSLEYCYFNAGLLLYRPEQCQLDRAEAFLRWRKERGGGLREGLPAIWFGDWTQEQTSYLAMYAGMTPPARPLDACYRLAGEPFGVFNHFMRDFLILPATLRRLTELVAQLPLDG